MHPYAVVSGQGRPIYMSVMCVTYCGKAVRDDRLMCIHSAPRSRRHYSEPVAGGGDVRAIPELKLGDEPHQVCGVRTHRAHVICMLLGVGGVGCILSSM